MRMTSRLPKAALQAVQPVGENEVVVGMDASLTKAIANNEVWVYRRKNRGDRLEKVVSTVSGQTRYREKLKCEATPRRGVTTKMVMSTHTRVTFMAKRSLVVEREHVISDLSATPITGFKACLHLLGGRVDIVPTTQTYAKSTRLN